MEVTTVAWAAAADTEVEVEAMVLLQVVEAVRSTSPTFVSFPT